MNEFAMTDNNEKEDAASYEGHAGDDDETVVEQLHEDFIRLLRERESGKTTN